MFTIAGVTILLLIFLVALWCALYVRHTGDKVRFYWSSPATTGWETMHVMIGEYRFQAVVYAATAIILALVPASFISHSLGLCLIASGVLGVFTVLFTLLMRYEYVGKDTELKTRYYPSGLPSRINTPASR